MLVKKLYSNPSFRPMVLTIAGFDPSGGAGVLADIKTFEMMGVYGIAVITGNTHQNDISFQGVRWLDKKQKEQNLALLADRFPVKAIKLGMHKDLNDVLHSIKLSEKHFGNIPIVWDPVMAASAGFDLNIQIKKATLNKILSSLALLTPNHLEVCRLGELHDAVEAANKLSILCPVLLKGGHSSDRKNATDKLFINGNLKKEYVAIRMKNAAKHGSGCVLSAAITASLAKGMTIENSIRRGKKYITQFLYSNNTLLGHHLN